MPDLNILEMIAGRAPGYAKITDANAQKLIVLMMVSDNDVGRTYGGELADLPGKTVGDLSIAQMKITSMMKDAVQWMKDNDPSVPDTFTATGTVEQVSSDKLILTVNTFVNGENTATETLNLW